MMKIAALILISTTLLCGIVSADLGEVDEKGGHYDQKTGVYHKHQQIIPPIEGNIVSIQPQAIAQGEIDAVTDAANDSLWYGAGFLFGVFGVGAAYVMPQSVPAQRLLGKSPEYLIFYTNSYRKTMRIKRTEQATTGCMLGGVVVALYYLYSAGQL